MKNVKPLVAILRSCFGQHIHMIKTTNVDDNFSKKDPENRIGKQAVLATVNSVRVNQLKEITMPGGIPGIQVNGGESEIRLGLEERILTSAADYTEPKSETEKRIFAKYENAVSIANAVNIAERERLIGIKNDINNQIETLNSAIAANELMLATFEEE